MNRGIVLGIDPDSDGVPAAIYSFGNLIDLRVFGFVEFFIFCQEKHSRPDLIAIEDTISNRFIYSRNRSGSASADMKIAQNVGMCKQSQKIIEKIAEHFKINVEKIPPTRDNWAKDKKRFEVLTGWSGMSSEDTRSAAYFGYLFK